jgi:integrase/recombinase XerD
MLGQFFISNYVQRCLQGGALGPAVNEVAAYLHERGHSPRVAQSYLLAAGHFLRWLALKRTPFSTVSEATLSAFLEGHLPRCRCRVPHGSRCHLRTALHHVLVVLRARGLAAPVQHRAPSPVDKVVNDFNAYLLDTRGAAAATCRIYVSYARRFLDVCFGAGEVDLRRLGAKDLIAFVLRQTRECAPATAAVVRTGLRSFLRFAQLHDLCDVDLAAAVPRVARWRRANLPRGLSEEQLAVLLAAFDLTTPAGRRDHAMVVCMAWLGLRANEVATLLLDDLDWRSGTLRVGRGKERRASLLPLPVPVGRALVGYLRHGRPRTSDRHVFVRHQLPTGQPMTSSGVTAVVGRAFERSRLEVPSRGAHTLRHTAATRMVRGGASIKEVADILRHRCLETTMIYAKVDLAALGEVALPWPEVRS